MIGQVLPVYTTYICSPWRRLCTRLSCLGSGPEEDGTHLPPPVGLPTGTSAGAAGLLAPGPGEMAAELLFDFGLVLVDTDDLPPLGPTTATHRALEGGKEEGKGGDGEKNRSY